jgi:hypothetical protein
MMGTPQAERCSVDGCEAYEAYGFTFPDGTVRRACIDQAHRAQVTAEWEEARRLQAEAIAQKMKPAQGALF